MESKDWVTGEYTLCALAGPANRQVGGRVPVPLYSDTRGSLSPHTPSFSILRIYSLEAFATLPGSRRSWTPARNQSGGAPPRAQPWRRTTPLQPSSPHAHRCNAHGTRLSAPRRPSPRRAVSGQGRIAAENIAGRASRFRGTQGTSVVGIFDLTVASTGA